jgi:hypothetical protein
MTIILTGETGTKTRWPRGWETHRDPDCNGCRARRGRRRRARGSRSLVITGLSLASSVRRWRRSLSLALSTT